MECGAVECTCHFHIFFLGPDLQDGVQLFLCVRLRGNDEQPIQQVNGDPMGRPSQPQTPI